MQPITKPKILITVIFTLFTLFSSSNQTPTLNNNFKNNNSVSLELVSENNEVSDAVNKINDLYNKVTSEHPQTVVETWLNNLQALIRHTSVLMGKESTISYNTAEGVANSALHILDYLLPLPDIWNSLNHELRLSAGRYFIEITERVSILMNVQMSGSIRQSYIFAGNKANLILKTKEFDYSRNLEIGLFDVGISLPIAGLDRPTEGSISAITAAKLPKLRQYMTPVDISVYQTIIAVKVGVTRDSLQLKHPHKLKITMYKDDYKGSTRHCAFWNPTSKNSWSGSGCTISYPIVFQMACECNHLTSFGVLDSSVQIDGGDDSNPTPPPITGNPDEIADQIDQLLGNITQVGVNTTTNEWKESLTNLTELVSAVTASDEIVESVSRPLALRITTSSLDSFSKLIEAPKDVWHNLTTSERRGSSTKIFKSVSNLAILMNSKQTDERTVIKFSSIEMQSKSFVVNETNKIHFNFANSATVEMPIRALIEDHLKNNSSLSTKNENRKISSSAALLSNLSHHLASDNLLPNSAVLSITVANKRESVSLKDGHKLKFVTQNNFRLVFRDRPQCSFWNLATHNWSTSGCTINRQQSTRSSTVCECDHLTDFAAITDVSNREEPSVAKSVLTYLFSSITCIFLGGSIYLTLKYNRTNYTLNDDQFKVKTNRFWLNLSVTCWLLVSHLLIMIGMDRTEVLAICEISSLALLYSLLTAFSFSLMLSIHLYLSTSRRHLFRYFPFRNFALFAYLFPLFLIVVSMFFILVTEARGSFGVMLKSLTGEYFCWISSSKYPGHIWIFVAPTTIIILVNCALLGAILMSIVQMQKKQVQVQVKRSTKEDRKGGSRENQLVNWYLVVILLFNFGFPWLLYVFYINEQMAIFFSYFFIVINGTQGITLFAEQYYVYWSNPQKRRRQSDTRTTKLSSSNH